MFPGMKDQILREIRRLAEERGYAPGQKFFVKETGIGTHLWRGKIWARWSDALSEAGYEPNTLNDKLNTNHVLMALAAATRNYQRFPTEAELNLYRDQNPSVPHVNVVKSHLGKRTDRIEALRRFCEEDNAYSDILPLLPKRSKELPETAAQGREGYVYLLQSGNHYKVGRSDDIERRFKEVRIALPEKVELLHAILTDDPPGIEAYWHRRFAEKRANGEWFRLSPVDVKAFRRRKFQ